MSFELDLYTVLVAVTPRVHPDFAPVETPRPYVTFQGFGGEVVNPLANDVPDKRNSFVMVSVWSDSRAEALTISRAIEDAMRAATAFFAKPMAAARSDFDADVPVYGCRQDFSCWHVA